MQSQVAGMVQGCLAASVLLSLWCLLGDSAAAALQHVAGANVLLGGTLGSVPMVLVLPCCAAATHCCAVLSWLLPCSCCVW